jgi:quercetin dioxygenase-like cupin family protein
MMKGRKETFLAAVGIALALPIATAMAQDDALPAGFASEPVLKASATADGEPLQLPSGTPEIVSVVGTLEAGGRTARHQHPVPVYVYVLEGELNVQTEGEEPRVYQAGEAFMESVNRWHQAFNNAEGQTRILVVFVGEQGQPTTVTE